MLYSYWQQMNCVAMRQILRFYIFNIFISLVFCDSLPVFCLCLSMQPSYGCQTFSLSFLTVRPFFPRPLLSLFSLFLKLCMIFSLQLPPLSVPVIMPVPIKFCVKLGTFECPAGGFDPVVTGAKLRKLSKPLHSSLRT